MTGSEWATDAAVSLVIDTVRSRPDFLAFARILGLRIAAGRSLDAYRMLVDIGSPPGTAHGIVEGWPVEQTQRRTPAGILTLPEEAACRLCLFIHDFEDHDWAALLTRSVKAADRARKTFPSEKVADASG